LGAAISGETLDTRPRSGNERFQSTGAIAIALLSLGLACAHRYSEDRRDWVGPRYGDFEQDLADCKERMEDTPFRYGGDPRLLFLDCMEKRGWYLKDRS
jgi:hypothetical protein